MAKLNQIIAIEKGIKSKNYAAVTDLHRLSDKPELFSGMQRTYRALDDEGEKLAPESKRVQATVADMWRGTARLMGEHFTIEARKDWSNTQARADIRVGDQVVLASVPVTYLLFLEKQLTDIRTMVAAYPTQDEGEEWRLDPQSGLYKTEAAQTHRTKKIQKPIVLLAPTVEHPGQAQLVTEDVIAGHWSMVKHTGAMPRTEKRTMLERVDSLLHAVKMAREEANSIDEVAAPKGWRRNLRLPHRNFDGGMTEILSLSA